MVLACAQSAGKKKKTVRHVHLGGGDEDEPQESEGNFAVECAARALNCVSRFAAEAQAREAKAEAERKLKAAEEEARKQKEANMDPKHLYASCSSCSSHSFVAAGRAKSDSPR